MQIGANVIDPADAESSPEWLQAQTQAQLVVALDMLRRVAAADLHELRHPVRCASTCGVTFPVDLRALRDAVAVEVLRLKITGRMEGIEHAEPPEQERRRGLRQPDRRNSRTMLGTAP